jgi:hypothetical protein
MINQVLNYINNRFLNYSYQSLIDSTFTAPDTIDGVFTDTFMAGEWVEISGTRLNDGIYLVSAIADDSMTVSTSYDKLIIAEVETEDVLYIKCEIPSELVSLVATIKTYDDSAEVGLSSESQGGRSVSYGSGDSSWTSVFSSKLSQWRKVRL